MIFLAEQCSLIIRGFIILYFDFNFQIQFCDRADKKLALPQKYSKTASSFFGQNFWEKLEEATWLELFERFTTFNWKKLQYLEAIL